MNELGEITDKIVQLLQYDPVSPLIFSSGLFLFLFGGFTFFYQFMRREVMLRIVYVTLFSLYFYYKTSGFFFLLLIAVSVSDFLIGKGIARSDRQGLRKGLLALSVALDIGLLIYFKYTNFFIGIVNGLSGHHWLDFQNIFLPVGISFFVFQSISYTADIYRRRIEPLGMWIDYIFFLSFFPQLVAGPIVRARDFIPQIRQNPLTVTREMFGTGIFLILSGLFKKAIISDYISLNFVDRVFDDPLLYSGFENLMGLYGYALQIYCDFSGYSDMAIGIALLLGFHFNKNFDSPYKSATITEFWRRWHISLGSWFRDYVYIPLGGSRVGKWKLLRNLLLVWAATGLWHGAAWNFVLWGLFYAVLLIAEKFALLPKLQKHPAIGRVYTLLFVLLGFVLFDAPSLSAAASRIAGLFGGAGAGVESLYYLRSYAVVLLLAVLGATPLPKRLLARLRKNRVCGVLLDVLEPIVLVALLALCTAYLIDGSFNPFLYFRF